MTWHVQLRAVVRLRGAARCWFASDEGGCEVEWRWVVWAVVLHCRRRQVVWVVVVRLRLAR